MKNIENKKLPRILVISNSAFSETNNNGKTLASFFENYPSEKIAQLYFNSEVPTHSRFSNFFRITDADVLTGIIKNKMVFGSEIINGEGGEVSYSSKMEIIDINNIKDSNLARLGREAIWKMAKGKIKNLEDWLDTFRPEVIFFCAGDSGFAYDMTEYIQLKYNTKLIVYITDDYILPRKKISPLWWVRRNFIKKQMRYSVQKSDLFITISKEMQTVYKNMFGIESILAINMTDSMKDNSLVVSESSDDINFIYAGGLHFNRYKTLSLLAQAIKKYNSSSINKRAFLKIYSNQKPSKKIQKLLNINGASKYYGSLNPIELRIALNSADFPVHVESFDFKSMEATRLSISTKISEYLSLGKPIVAIGPSSLASISYLEDCAYCISSEANVGEQISKFLENEELQKELSKAAINKYEANHNKEMITNNLKNEILRIFEDTI